MVQSLNSILGKTLSQIVLIVFISYIKGTISNLLLNWYTKYIFNKKTNLHKDIVKNIKNKMHKLFPLFFKDFTSLFFSSNKLIIIEYFLSLKISTISLYLLFSAVFNGESPSKFFIFLSAPNITNFLTKISFPEKTE